MRPLPRILLIEDDPKLSRLLRDYLRSQGLESEQALDGSEGLLRALQEPFDLIMLDVMLPGMNGFDVLRALRAQSSVPVLMLTARGGENDRIHGLESGADDYLPKTASSRELLARIRALLRRAQSPPVATQLQSLLPTTLLFSHTAHAFRKVSTKAACT
jgi:DNA-binding response OmpR family regulator